MWRRPPSSSTWHRFVELVGGQLFFSAAIVLASKYDLSTTISSISKSRKSA